jgi:hypothetical protein
VTVWRTGPTFPSGPARAAIRSRTCLLLGSRTQRHASSDPDRAFAALIATPFDSVRAVILGQDPYPTRSRAMGLAFSVPRDLPPLPKSLQLIRQSCRPTEVSCRPPTGHSRHGRAMPIPSGFGTPRPDARIVDLGALRQELGLDTP